MRKQKPIFCRLFLVAGLWLAALVSVAQISPEQQTRFDNSRVLVDRGQHDLAMRELLPLLQTPTGTPNDLAPDAHYLYALAAYRAGKLADAESTLNWLRVTFPNWAGMADALYLQATVAFEKRNYAEAIGLLNSISGNTLQAESKQLKQHYLKQLNNRQELAALAAKYPSDKEIGTAYANQILATYTSADKQLLEQLVSRHRLDATLYRPDNSLKKPVYRVGVLFPFGLEGSGTKRNQFVVALYEGLRYAADSLSQRGQKIELFTYETTAATNTLKQLLQLPELQTMDLLVGPVYKSGSRIVSRFANQHRIPVVNPLSEDQELLKESPLLFLFESSLQTKARRLAEFAFHNFKPTDTLQAPKGTVLYESRRDDSLFAAFYKREFEQLGGKISSFRKVHSKDKAYNTALISKLDVKPLSHMAVFSDQPNVAANVMSLLDSRDTTIAVFAPASWLEMQQVTLEQLDNHQVYFLSPHVILPDNPGARTFAKGYRRRTNLPPSVYANSGFELMWFFGQALHQFGTNFGPGLAATGHRSGALYHGLDYSKGNDNAFLPLLKLEMARLQRANNPTGPQNFLPPPVPEQKNEQPKPNKK